MKEIEMIKNEIVKGGGEIKSSWNTGVNEYAIDLLDNLEEYIECGDYTIEEVLDDSQMLEKALLNGAKDWKEYSYGGMALIYDTDIAKSLCSPSELRKSQNGTYIPNSKENWLDVQARALFQAFNKIQKSIAAVKTLEKDNSLLDSLHRYENNVKSAQRNIKSKEEKDVIR